QDGVRIQAFTPGGEVIGHWDSPPHAYGVAVASDGTLYVTLDGPNPIVTLAPTGEITGHLGTSTADPGMLTGAESVVVTGTGQILVRQDDRVETFTPDGHFVEERSLRETNGQPLSGHAAMAIDDADAIYISTSDTTVLKVNADGSIGGRW